MRALAVTLAVAAAALLAAPTAGAAVYCVDLASTAGCDHVEPAGALAAAFTGANNSVADDTIMVGAGTYTGPFAGAAGDGALSVVGAGTTATTLTVAAGSQTVLSFAAPGSSVSHVHVQLPAATGDTALALDGGASDVLIDDPDGSTNAIGVEMDHPDSFSGTIHLGNGSGSIGVDRTANGSGLETVSDSSIFAVQGMLLTSGTWDVFRDRIVAFNRGIQALDGTTMPAVVDASDSLVRVTTTDPSTCGGVPCFGLGVSGSSTLSGERLTVVGAGPYPGAWALGSAGKTATLDLFSTVVDGFTPALQCGQSGGGTATLHADYSDFALPVTTSGGCTAPPAAHNRTDAPDLVANSFEPKWDSPLVDHGDPHTVLLLGATDLDGGPRIVGPGIDIGAFEYQHRPPTVTGVSVPQAPVGAPVPFAVAKAADPDPGDTLTFTWAFDDGGAGSGATLTHAFATPGAHAATVIATDPTGLAATSTVTVTVIAVPVAPPRRPVSRPVVDRTPPAISKLRVKPSHFRASSRKARIAKRAPLGARITLDLSEPATLALTFERHGKKLHGSVSLAGAHGGANAIRFYGRVGSHALKPGKYTLRVTATDAAGNRSAAAHKSFTIVRR